MSEDRLIEIETKVLHQEALLEELHQVLYRQQATIDQLQAKVDSLVKRIGETEDIGPHAVKPPHY